VVAVEQGWKVCKRCSHRAGQPVLKPANKFYKAKGCWCMECTRAYGVDYRAKQKERLPKKRVPAKMGAPDKEIK
jgi:hypothetical protein